MKPVPKDYPNTRVLQGAAPARITPPQKMLCQKWLSAEKMIAWTAKCGLSQQFIPERKAFLSDTQSQACGILLSSAYRTEPLPHEVRRQSASGAPKSPQ
jgi:hypothetical protein